MTKMEVHIESLSELNKFKREFSEIVKFVRAADGKYILHIDTTTHRSPATRSVFITKSQFNAAMSPAMREGSPSAFSSRVAGGHFLPRRLNAAYSAYQRAQARADLEANVPGSALIRNRREYFAVYGDSLALFPPGRMGDVLNQALRDASALR